ncbi:MAG: two component sigma-54-specific Fis family transcriptional regulator [Osedax symbiont Rs1]|nr:MAG: two component sigma-54-specific Fis family transcriptional regulator [Osedax symbiont Rs1]
MHKLSNKVLLVDDERSIRMSLAQSIELAGFEVITCDSGKAALAQLYPQWEGVIVSDISMPEMDGLSLMQQVNAIDRDIPMVLMTGHGDISMAVAAIQQGAYDFLEKPFPPDKLVEVIRRGCEKRTLSLENYQLRNELESQTALGPRIIGNSPQIIQLRRLVQSVADAPTDILIEAETGTGKDLLARYIHEHSQRREHKFVAINCGAVPENLIESELFGHERGAFTDAKARRIGKFEYADGGTVFLDEIESMPLVLQVKLLRVIEERSIERLGSNESIKLNLRIVAATKVDLKKLAEQGLFREDLYYRLNVVKVTIPPLRQRKDDIPLLFQHFSIIASTQYGRDVEELSRERMAALMRHDWPGNIRELRNIAERNVLLGESCTFGFDDELISPESAVSNLGEQVAQFEKLLIHTELAKCGGSIRDTQLSLALPRKTLYDKMKKYGLDKKDYKP